jgi:hypothetical protein
MAYDQNERSNAERKEAGQENVAGGLNEPRNDEIGTEFAADTWTGAEFHPNEAAARASIDYDPETYTERYRGENAVGGDDAGVTTANNDQSPASPAGADDDHAGERAAARSAYANEVGAKDRSARYETAGEIAPPLDHRVEPRPAADDPEEEEPASGLGWTGLGISILSLFFLPYLVAPIGIIIGYLSYRRNARTLGMWAMLIGAIAIVGAIIVYPFFVAR